MDLTGVNLILDRLQKIEENQREIHSKIESAETKIADFARALATLALIQANLIRALGDLADKEEARSKTQKFSARKAGSDFTN
jgi:regulator of replication initiation timing